MWKRQLAPRVELIDELCDSLNEKVPLISDALKTELDRRIGGFAEERGSHEASPTIPIILPVFFLPAASAELE